MASRKKVVPMQFEQESSGNSIDQSVVTVLEDNNMTQINEMNNVKLNLNSNVWDDRRVWTQPEQKPALNLTKAQIMAATPVPFLEELFNEGRIKLTNTANQSRAEGIPVIFDNSIQMKQLFKALAPVQYGVRGVWVAQRTAQQRDIYMLDVVGDHSRWISEESDGVHVKYDVHYAALTYNNMGNETISKGKLNPMQQVLKVQVDGYNAWVDAHNNAVKKSVSIDPMTKELYKLSESEVALIAKCIPQADPNKFVQYNTVHQVVYETVINKYTLEAWLNLAETKPAFEIFTFARSWEAALKRLESKLEAGIRAYRNELATLSGVDIWTEDNVQSE